MTVDRLLSSDYSRKGTAYSPWRFPEAQSSDWLPGLFFVKRSSRSLSAHSSTHNPSRFSKAAVAALAKDREGISAPLKSQLDQRYIVVAQILGNAEKC